jgi:hypothetical protein
MLNTPQEQQINVSFGTIKGVVQTISNRDRLQFVLYDVIFDAPVICYLDDSEENQLQHILGKKVLVTGKITRQPETGQPVRIEMITEITILKNMGNYQLGRGIFEWQAGDEPAEITIRRLRDGED